MKKKWIILIVLLALGSAVFFYLRVRKTDDFEPQIKAKLAQLVKDASAGLYQLDMEHIEIDITSGSVKAKNILLSVDSTRMLELEKANMLSNDIYEISLKELDLDGLSPLELLNGKNIQLDHLRIDSPQIKITHSIRQKEKKDTGNIYERININGQSYAIGQLLLNNIMLTVINRDKNRSVSSLKNVSASFTDIKIDSSTITDSTRFLFAKDAVIFIKGFSQVTEKKRYHFNIDSVVLRPQYGSLQFYDMSLKPEGSKQDFNKLISHQQDRYDIKIKKGSIKNINWFSLVAGDGLLAEEVKMEGGIINIYHDRSLPSGPPKSDNFPHQLLMKADLPVLVKKIFLEDFFVAYEELNPKSMHSGTVAFHHINGAISNVTNIDTAVNRDPYTTITATADFVNAGKLNAVFRFDLANEKTGNFSVDASLGRMDGAPLNKITEGLSLIKIKSLQIDQLTARIKGSHKSATGNILFAYHDLSFDVLKNDEGELKKRGLFSFIANTIIVNKSNPSKEGRPVKQFAVFQEHSTERSFFNLIWKTILQGLLKTVK